MASKKSLLLQIARVARSAGSAASRFARLVELRALSPEAVAAASHAPRFRAPSPAIPPHVMAARPPNVDVPSFGMGSSKDAFKPGGGRTVNNNLVARDASEEKKFEVRDEDVKSDEAIWALYERWCDFHNEKRETEEMVRRFNKFKSSALFVCNKRIMELNRFADGKVMEMCANRAGFIMAEEAEEAGSNVCVIDKRGGGFLRQVYALFEVVDGKLFVLFPTDKRNKSVGEFKEVPGEFQVLPGGRLFADLPKDHELVQVDLDFIKEQGECFF